MRRRVRIRLRLMYLMMVLLIKRPRSSCPWIHVVSHNDGESRMVVKIKMSMFISFTTSAFICKVLEYLIHCIIYLAKESIQIAATIELLQRSHRSQAQTLQESSPQNVHNAAKSFRIVLLLKMSIL